MSTTTIPATKTIAFFGATGDCANHCLASTLKSNSTFDQQYHCTALVRSSAKLLTLLKSKHVPESFLSPPQLTIIEGDVRDISVVQRTLSSTPIGLSEIVDLIVSGLGSNPIFQWSLTEPVTLSDPTICQDGGKVILEAAKDLVSSQRPETKKPLFVYVSTTGIAPPSAARDVPILFLPLYHWLLFVPHEDKRVFEKNLRATMELDERERGIRGFVAVKPSLLVDGEGKGLVSVREGVEGRPAVGYKIARKDVGRWMFEKLVRPEEGFREEWVNGSVSITY